MKKENYLNKIATIGDIQEATKRIDLLLTAVVIVLFIGFATIFIGVASIFIQFWQLNTNMQSELTKSVNQNIQTQNNLNTSVNNLIKKLK